MPRNPNNPRIPKPPKPPKIPSLSREEIFEFYLGMKPPRRVTALRAKLIVHFPDRRIACKEQLQIWAAEDKWKDRAQEHDHQVEHEVQLRIFNEHVKQRWNAREAFRCVAQQFLVKVLKGMKDIEIKTLPQAAQAVDIADKLMARAQLLPGGGEIAAEGGINPTDRGALEQAEKDIIGKMQALAKNGNGSTTKH